MPERTFLSSEYSFADRLVEIPKRGPAGPEGMRSHSLASLRDATRVRFAPRDETRAEPGAFDVSLAEIAISAAHR